MTNGASTTKLIDMTAISSGTGPRALASMRNKTPNATPAAQPIAMAREVDVCMDFRKRLPRAGALGLLRQSNRYHRFCHADACPRAVLCRRFVRSTAANADRV